MSNRSNHHGLTPAQRDVVRDLVRELESVLIGETAAMRWLPRVLSAFVIGREQVSEKVERSKDFVPAQLIASTEAWLRLTPRESQVLRHVVSGQSNHHIASDLSCSSRTVEVHVSRLLEKSGCISRAELIARTWAQTFEIERG